MFWAFMAFLDNAVHQRGGQIAACLHCCSGIIPGQPKQGSAEQHRDALPRRRRKKQTEKESGAKRQRLLINSSFFRVRIGLTAGRSGAGDWVGLRTDAKRNAAFPDIQGKAELTGMVLDLTLLR